MYRDNKLRTQSQIAAPIPSLSINLSLTEKVEIVSRLKLIKHIGAAIKILMQCNFKRKSHLMMRIFRGHQYGIWTVS